VGKHSWVEIVTAPLQSNPPSRLLTSGKEGLPVVRRAG